MTTFYSYLQYLSIQSENVEVFENRCDKESFQSVVQYKQLLEVGS